MALDSKRYTRIHNKTGDELTKIQQVHDSGIMNVIIDYPEDDQVMTAVMHQMQKMQDELDYLRTEISTNKDKTSMTIGTSSNTALAGDTNIVTIGSNTTIAFGDMQSKTVKGKTTYSIVMTVTNGGVSKATTLTLT